MQTKGILFDIENCRGEKRHTRSQDFYNFQAFLTCLFVVRKLSIGHGDQTTDEQAVLSLLRFPQPMVWQVVLSHVQEGANKTTRGRVDTGQGSMVLPHSLLLQTSAERDELQHAGRFRPPACALLSSRSPSNLLQVNRVDGGFD